MIRLLGCIFALACLVVTSGCNKGGDTATDGNKAFASASPEIKAVWDKAVAAGKAKDYSTAVLAFRDLSALPGLTPEQTKAAEQASAKISDQMYDAANSGDAKASKAIDDLRGSLRR